MIVVKFLSIERQVLTRSNMGCTRPKRFISMYLSDGRIPNKSNSGLDWYMAFINEIKLVVSREVSGETGRCNESSLVLNRGFSSGFSNYSN